MLRFPEMKPIKLWFGKIVEKINSLWRLPKAPRIFLGAFFSRFDVLENREVKTD